MKLLFFGERMFQWFSNLLGYGQTEQVYEQVCDHVSDMLCHYAGGEYEFSNYIPDFALSLTDAMYEFAKENAYSLAATTLIGGGIGLYYYASRNASTVKVNYVGPTQRHQQLYDAIQGKNVDVAADLIAQMSVDDLNQADQNGNTLLLTSLKQSRKVCELLINKFLQKRSAMNTQMPNGTSIFQDEKLGRRLLAFANGRHNNYACLDATRLLDATTGQYKNYACLDAARFQGNIANDADKQVILNRKAADPQAYNQSTQIQPIIKGEFTRKQIQQCAELVDKAKAGVCTTFALAVADKLMVLFPNERIKVVAHNGGADGSHVYVVMNHQAEDWKLNDLKNQSTDGARKNLMLKAAEEFDKAYIVDPWLASLGWKDGVFDFANYCHQFEPFLKSVELRYDTGSISPKNTLTSR